MDKTQELENRIIKLEEEIKSLKSSNTIPYEVLKSFEGVGFFKTSGVTNLPDGWETHLVPYSTFRIERGESTAPLWLPLYVYDESF